MAVELHLDVELLAPATVFFVQRLKSKLGEVLILVLSSFLRVPIVSALVRGVAAAAALLPYAVGRVQAPLRCAAACAGFAQQHCRYTAPHRRRPASLPASAARRAVGRGPVPVRLSRNRSDRY